MHSTERAWAEIDLGDLAHNYREIQKLVGPRRVYAVIKADAYGHGAPQVAHALAKAGTSDFAVATPQEALQLRRHGITQPILMMGMADAKWAPILAQEDISLAVCSLDAAHEYAEALEKSNTTAKIHLKADTGMGRLGFPAKDRAEAAEEMIQAANLAPFELEGIFSHFAVADEHSRDDYTKEQYSLFERLVKKLEDKGLKAPVLHCANSAGTVSHPYSWAGGVRPGLVLYGSNPGEDTPLPLRQIMNLRARIAQVKPVKKGEGVSYGLAWTAPRDSIVATVSIGYADGVLRSLSNKMDMLVKGRRAPQVGRVCMDMCMLDITDIPGVEVGDAATVFGYDGNEYISCNEVAKNAGTIPYEIFCAVSRRVPRYYRLKGELVDETCYIDYL